MYAETDSTNKVSGAGFHFEDKVVAYYLTFLLIDQPPFDPSMGAISGMNFMVRPDGWFLDDLLLTLAVGDSTSRVAISIKSNAQFTSSGAPAEFVKLLWEQFLHEGSDKFDPSRDRMGMIQGPLSGGLGVVCHVTCHQARRPNAGRHPQDRIHDR